MEDNSKIKQQIEEKFQQLIKNAETDENLKSEVFNSLARIDGICSFLDLFTNQFLKSEAEFLINLNSPPDTINPSDTNNIQNNNS